MFTIGRHIAAFAYLMGVFGFGIYDFFYNNDLNLASALGYGAQWPLVLLQAV